MECVSISSNDMLQLGVLLPLSKTELLQDSVKERKNKQKKERNGCNEWIYFNT